jgi:LCP family protein required for cell wall assembly
VLPERSAGRGRRVARVLSWIAVVTSVSILALAGVGYAFVMRYDGNINRIGGVLGDDAAVAAGGPRNVLIVGSDSRDVEGNAFQGVGDEVITGQRSDVIILAHLYGGTDKVQLVSIPRDSWVDIPAFTEPETGETTAAQTAKINQAFFLGGPALLVSTVEQLSGLQIDHYMQVDFDGFRGIVNELGGVEVCLSEPAKEAQSEIDLPAGVSTVNGEQALAFVRQRTGLPRGDLDRIDRQQRLIGGMVRKVLSAGTLLNPLKLNGVLDTATKSLQVDEGLSFGELRDLALRFRDVSANGVAFTTVPIADSAARRRGQSVVLIDDIAAAQLFTQIRNDVPPGTPPPPDDSALIVAPENVQARVFNGAGVSGLGRRAADELAAVGFQIVEPPSDRGTDAAETVVYHGPGKADSAATLAAAVPGSRSELDPSLDETLEIVVGTSYAGARQVTVGGAPPPADVITAAADPCGV